MKVDAIRNSSFETLRLISIFLIIVMHVSALIEYENLSLSNKLAVCTINSIGNIGVTCFVLISGYFGVKYSRKKLIKLTLTTTVYCTLIAALRFGLFSVQTANALLVVPSYNLWFITCYLILMILSPYLNEFCVLLKKKDYLRMLLYLFFLLCVFPTISIKGATNDIVLRQGGKNLVYFLFIYLLGRYIFLHSRLILSRLKLGGIFVLSTLLIISLNIMVSYYFHKKLFIFSFDCSPLILISSLCIFSIFKSLEYHSKIINWFASSVFGIYLLSDVYYILNDRYINLSNYSANKFFIIQLVIICILSWFFSLIIDKTIGFVLRYLIDKICIKLKIT